MASADSDASRAASAAWGLASPVLAVVFVSDNGDCCRCCCVSLEVGACATDLTSLFESCRRRASFSI